MVELQKEDLEIINSNKGMVAGFSLREDLGFVLEKEGKEGLEKIEKAMEDLGYQLKYNQIQRYQWYPLSLNFLILILIKKIFGWQEEKIIEWGKRNARKDLFIKLALKYFFSLEQTLKKATEYWKRYFSVGELKVEEINKNERYLYFVIKEFLGHPLFCLILRGYFEQMLSYVLPKETIKSEEVECCFKGGSSHRFKITW
jgi:hypothetical protein